MVPVPLTSADACVGRGLQPPAGGLAGGAGGSTSWKNGAGGALPGGKYSGALVPPVPSERMKR